MGNYTSKLFSSNVSQKGNNEGQVVIQQTTAEDNNMCTPILSERRMLIDPRSISVGIMRTPIEVKDTPTGVIKKVPSAIPKYLQKRQYLETDMDVVMPPLTPKKRLPSLTDSQSDLDESQAHLTPNVNAAKDLKEMTPTDIDRYNILGLDPRSPAADFDRTPILLPKSLASLKARSQENLKSTGSYEEKFHNSRNSCQETSLNIPKIELSFDISLESSENQNKLDVEKQSKLHISNTSQSNSNSSISESEKEVTVIKNPKFKNEKEESLISNEQTIVADKEENQNDVDKLNDCKVIDYNMHIKNDDKIKVWHDTLSSEENVSSDDEQKKYLAEKLPQQQTLKEDIIITFDEHIINNSSSKSRKMQESYQKKGIKVDESKFTLNEKTFTPENKNRTEMLKNRTPLGNRSNNDQVRKLLSKSPQHLLKNKISSNRIQQENTPPCKKYGTKIKNGTQWDPNSTVFI